MVVWAYRWMGNGTEGKLTEMDDRADSGCVALLVIATNRGNVYLLPYTGSRDI